MKKSTLFLIVLVAIFFTSTLVLLYLNFNKSRPVITSIPIPTTSVIPTVIVDTTINWKTYGNTKNGFSFKYPNNYDYVINEYLKDGYTQITLAKSTDFSPIPIGEPHLMISILDKTIDTSNHPIYNVNNTIGIGLKNISGIAADIRQSNFKSKEISYVLNHLSKTYIFTLRNGDNQYNTNIFDQILSTFKFTSPDYLLEDGSTYRVIDNYLSWDNCGSEDNETSLKIKQKISALAQVSEKEINGLKIISTATLGFTSADIKQFYLCQAGAFSPLKVLSNKILWISSCGTGAYWDGVEKCEETRTAIQKLYKL